jgi:SAM-dependent methyltransferase
MKWKNKALIQNLVSKLPENFSYNVYYWMQRKFGALQSTNPINVLTSRVNTMQYIHRNGHTVEGKKFLEIGTGRGINLPIAWWLCGASEIVTVDVNPYLKEELVMSDLTYMRNHQNELKNLFSSIPHGSLFDKRFELLMNCKDGLQDLLSLTNIRYLAPADAGCLNFNPNSFDYHISYSVLQYIPPIDLQRILREAIRLTKEDGLIVHYIDLTDHFSHYDHSITYINFLQFSEEQWKRLAGNRYMYHSRLRIDDYMDMFKTLECKIVCSDTVVDERSLAAIHQGLPLDERFKNKDPKTNATVRAWIVACPSETR